MKIKKMGKAGYKALVSRVRTLLLREKVVVGTLNEQTVGRSRRLTLTDKVDGKTRCLYIPAAMEGKVRGWIANWKELKSLVQGMGEATRSDLVAEITALTGRPTARGANRPRSKSKPRKAASGARQRSRQTVSRPRPRRS